MRTTRYYEGSLNIEGAECPATFSVQADWHGGRLEDWHGFRLLDFRLGLATLPFSMALKILGAEELRRQTDLAEAMWAAEERTTLRERAA